jgi:integrase
MTAKLNPKFELKERTRRGEGRIFKVGSDGKTCKPGSKKSGVWWIDYTMTGPDGKKKRIRKALKDDKGFTVRDKPIAQRMQKELVGQYVAAGPVAAMQALQLELESAESKLAKAMDEANPPLSIADAWKSYLSNPERPDSGERTLKDYKSYWDKFTTWIKNEQTNIKYMREVTAITAQDYAKYLTKDGASPNTFNKHTGFLKLIFRVLEEPARIQENPFGRIRKKALKTNVRRELTIAELKTVLAKAKGDLQMLLSIGTFTGLRLGDCATLTWGEVDLDRGLIKRIPRKTASRKKTPVVIGIPSALHSHLSLIPQKKRTGFILPELAERYDRDPSLLTKQIQKHFEDNGIMTLQAKTGKEWYTKAHKAWEDNNRNDKEPIYKRAVVEVGFHSLRHTYVSIQAEQGTPMAVVQSVIGHGSPAMTAHYTHIGEAAAIEAANAFDGQITEAGGKEVREPLPPWAAEGLKLMTDENWKEIRKELLCIS